jgi:hypothetical protein
MSQSGTIAAIGFPALALAMTVDSALGIGGGAFIADICRTILDDVMAADTEGGDGMAMQPKPLPLILLSLAATLGMVALSAAFLAAGIDRHPTPAVVATVERLAQDIGATPADVAAARSAVRDWAADYRVVPGVSIITLLRHRTLALRPL